MANGIYDMEPLIPRLLCAGNRDFEVPNFDGFTNPDAIPNKISMPGFYRAPASRPHKSA
jgi:hypothetical protein